jgi:hypothetical protein
MESIDPRALEDLINAVPEYRRLMMVKLSFSLEFGRITVTSRTVHPKKRNEDDRRRNVNQDVVESTIDQVR